MDEVKNSVLSRSKSMPPHSFSTPPLSRRSTNLNLNRLKNAKLLADNAIKNNKIFTIHGPYPAVRESLRSRGWVEKFFTIPQKVNKPKPANEPANEDNHSDSNADDDDTDDNCDGDGNHIDLNDFGGKVPPWEEENGFFGVTSRLVKKIPPSFLWGVRRDVFDPKTLSKDQVINHYGHTVFTTKVGLCMYLRDLPWFEEGNCDSFFPRCYRLSQEDEKLAFIDDFRLTACTSLLKIVSGEYSQEILETDNEKDQKKKHTKYSLPTNLIPFALAECNRYLQSIIHEDIDAPDMKPSDEAYNEFIKSYYLVSQKNAKVANAEAYSTQISDTLSRIANAYPQFEIDGTKDAWIVKPGAKSRGRGIQCFNNLEEMLKLVDAQVVMKESKYVVQKYIERPLLIYRTKFDIRQWFVVTDWNPLTMYFYKECYLRFCSQEFTLDDMNESIHLSNNSIQKNYKNGERAEELPDENMWTSEEFQEYLEKINAPEGVWENLIYPGMKKAVICALLCCQDVVENRKSAFELFGADFMLGDDYQPWLIEINSSPCMAPSTAITARMCSEVLEDTIKIVIDRKADKNADIGLFELAYRQPLVPIPPYTGMTFQIDGQAIKKSYLMSHRKCRSDESLSKSVASLLEEEEDGKGKRRAESRSRSLSDDDGDDDEPRSRSVSSDTDKPRQQSLSHRRLSKGLIMNMELVKGNGLLKVKSCKIKGANADTGRTKSRVGRLGDESCDSFSKVSSRPKKLCERRRNGPLHATQTTPDTSRDISNDASSGDGQNSEDGMAANAAPDVASIIGTSAIGVPLICRNSTMFKIRQSRSGWRNSSVIQPSVMKTNNATEEKKVRERARYTGSKASKDPSDADDLKGDDSLIVDAESCEQTSTLKNAVPTIDLLSNLSSEEKGSSEFTKPLRFYPTNDSSRHTASHSGDILHPTSSKELPQKGNRTGVSTTLLSSNVMPFSPFILDYGPSRKPPIQSLDLTISLLKAPPPRRLGEITNYSWSSNLTQTFASRSRAPMVDGRHSRLLLRYTSASTSDKTGVPIPTTPIHAPAFPQIVKNYLERNINQQNRTHNINLLHPRSPKLSIITQSLNFV